MSSIFQSLGKWTHSSIVLVVATLPLPTVLAQPNTKETTNLQEFSSNLASMQKDAMFSLSLEIGKHWRGPEAATLKKVSQSHPIVLTWETKDLEKKIGLSVDQIERLVVLMPAPNGWVILLTTVGPIDRAKVLRALVPDATEKDSAGKSYFTSDKIPLAVLLVDQRTLVAGSPKVVELFLERPAPAKTKVSTEPLQNQVLMAARIDSLLLGGFAKSLGPKGETYLPIMDAKFWSLSVETKNKQLLLKLQAEFPTMEKAIKAESPLKQVLNDVEQYFEFAESQMQPFFKKELKEYPRIEDLEPRMMATLKAARAGLKGTVFKQQGNGLEASVLIKADEPVTSFVLLLSMMPRAGKE